MLNKTDALSDCHLWILNPRISRRISKCGFQNANDLRNNNITNYNQIYIYMHLKARMIDIKLCFLRAKM